VHLRLAIEGEILFPYDLFPNIYIFKNHILAAKYIVLNIRHKNRVYLYSPKNLKVPFRVQWIFAILLSLSAKKILGVHAHLSKC